MVIRWQGRTVCITRSASLAIFTNDNSGASMNNSSCHLSTPKNILFELTGVSNQFIPSVYLQKGVLVAVDTINDAPTFMATKQLIAPVTANPQRDSRRYGAEIEKVSGTLAKTLIGH